MLSIAHNTLTALRPSPLVVHTMRHTAWRLLTTKVVTSAAEALADLSLRGKKVAIGGFGTTGVPETLVEELSKKDDATDLTIAALDAGPDWFGLNKIIRAGKAKTIVTSFIGESKTVQDQFFAGKLDLQLVPLGTMSAQFRLAGSGIPAFYTRTGVGTMYADGGVPVRMAADGSHEVQVASPPKQVDTINGRDYILEPANEVDLALVKAWKADTMGNLVFHGAAQNSNPDIAKAGKVCLVEAEEIVQVGELDPNHVQLPGIFVDKVVPAEINTKPIHRLRTQKSMPKDEKISRGRKRIIKRVVKEFKDGMYINLGIGIPVAASNYLPEGLDLEIHSENGILGVGPYPPSVDTVDPDFINARKETITPLKGASLFSASDSFEMVRGGHLDLTVLGGLQVSANGDLANWIIPGKLIIGFGGAFDLVGSGSRVIVTMDHVAKDGTPKIVEECKFPLTGKRVVDMIITDKAVFDVDLELGGLTMTEIAPGLTVDEVRAVTGCDFAVAEPLRMMDEDVATQGESSSSLASSELPAVATTVNPLALAT